MLAPYRPFATHPTYFHDWSWPDGTFWWHSLSASEQAAWAIVWATAECGLLAAIGSFMAAWAAKSAASTAIDLSQKDRDERKIAKNAEDSEANWRAALSLDASVKRLLELVKLAISALEAAESIPADSHGNRRVQFGTPNFDYMADSLAHADIARIGNLAHLASGVSGEFGTVILQCLTWSRESAALLEHVIDVRTRNIQGNAYTYYFVDYWYVHDALLACRKLLRHAENAATLIEDITRSAEGGLGNDGKN